MPRTILDVTRLLTRAAHPAATGVDRVELAYARRAIGLPAGRAAFAAIAGTRVGLLRREGVERFVASLDAKWSAGAGDAASFARLAERLGAPPPPPTPLRAADDTTRRALLLRAEAMVASRRRGLGEGDVYVHVSHIRLDRPAAFAGVTAAGATLAILVHDLIPYRFPEYGRPGGAEQHATRMTTALDHATALIANSAATGDDLRAFAAETGRAAPPIVVAPLGLEGVFARSVAPLGAARPYFVSLGTIEPRKNHLLLLHVWRRIAERLGERTPTLVLVGRRGWENEMVVDLLERSPAIRAHVVETNDLPDDALAAVIRGARALLFPSFAEGYGLPLGEALALGAPAIVSDLPSFREIAGDAAERLDALDGPAWEAAILDYAAEPSPRRDAARARASRFVAPSWDAHFATVADVTGL